MATTFQNDIEFESNNVIHQTLQAIGDTDQTGVKILDLSAKTFPTNRQAGESGVAADHSFTLMEAKWSVQGFEYVQLKWDAATDDEIITMSGDGSADFWVKGGRKDPKSTTPVGDVLLDSQGAGTDSSYFIQLIWKKHKLA
jgi:hypothetical protein